MICLFQIGFYKDVNGLDSYDTLGYLAFELLRSTRLVVDTGMHRFKWSREKVLRQNPLKNEGNIRLNLIKMRPFLPRVRNLMSDRPIHMI